MGFPTRLEFYSCLEFTDSSRELQWFFFLLPLPRFRKLFPCRVQLFLCSLYFYHTEQNFRLDSEGRGHLGCLCGPYCGLIFCFGAFGFSGAGKLDQGLDPISSGLALQTPGLLSSLSPKVSLDGVAGSGGPTSFSPPFWSLQVFAGVCCSCRPGWGAAVSCAWRGLPSAVWCLAQVPPWLEGWGSWLGEPGWACWLEWVWGGGPKPSPSHCSSVNQNASSPGYQMFPNQRYR